MPPPADLLATFTVTVPPGPVRQRTGKQKWQGAKTDFREEAKPAVSCLSSEPCVMSGRDSGRCGVGAAPNKPLRKGAEFVLKPTWPRCGRCYFRMAKEEC